MDSSTKKGKWEGLNPSISFALPCGLWGLNRPCVYLYWSDKPIYNGYICKTSKGNANARDEPEVVKN